MASDRHIIIDGWNAVRSNRSTERTFLEHGLDAAREVFWKLVEPLHDYAGSRVTIVYDGKGEEISIQRRNGINTLSEVFTPSYMTADELIEQLCATSSNPSSITVVTRDNLLRLTSTTFGATALSPDKLFDSAGGCAKAMAESLHLSNSKEDRKWRSENAFSALDSLDLEIQAAAKRAEIMSKHMKKRRKRLLARAEQADDSAGGADAAENAGGAADPRDGKSTARAQSDCAAERTQSGGADAAENAGGGGDFRDGKSAARAQSDCAAERTQSGGAGAQFGRGAGRSGATQASDKYGAAGRSGALLSSGRVCATQPAGHSKTRGGEKFAQKLKSFSAPELRKSLEKSAKRSEKNAAKNAKGAAGQSGAASQKMSFKEALGKSLSLAEIAAVKILKK